MGGSKYPFQRWNGGSSYLWYQESIIDPIYNILFQKQPLKHLPQDMSSDISLALPSYHTQATYFDLSELRKIGKDKTYKEIVYATFQGYCKYLKNENLKNENESIYSLGDIASKSVIDSIVQTTHKKHSATYSYAQVFSRQLAMYLDIEVAATECTLQEMDRYVKLKHFLNVNDEKLHFCQFPIMRINKDVSDFWKQIVGQMEETAMRKLVKPKNVGPDIRIIMWIAKA